MDARAPKKCHQYKKNRTKVQEKFASKISYRLSWLTERTTEFLKPWEITTLNSSLREQLPLQKRLVPTRSIPVPGGPRLFVSVQTLWATAAIFIPSGKALGTPAPVPPLPEAGSQH
ncbi:PREDICTED: uncharacterized protein C3orf22 homolog [Condylura cristata]|uniref:uncharacterized protein C3orf22 homolog n=1 Tax=Condylura cristata TaxID=143302 RepID=UPI0003343F6B|nr:PREDICTED: uncharacterized protein C3orf22 homolog [Condylura cristata]